jgi:hypothetical protein
LRFGFVWSIASTMWNADPVPIEIRSYSLIANPHFVPFNQYNYV